VLDFYKERGVPILHGKTAQGAARNTQALHFLASLRDPETKTGLPILHGETTLGAARNTQTLHFLASFRDPETKGRV
jgi:hypothetical protein